MLLTQILLAGTFAARPTASTLPNGTLYAATDTGVIYQVQSAAWATWYPAPSGVGTVTSVATGTGLTGGPITSTGTINLANTAVTPGTYGDASNVAQITVDAQGRITAAADVAISGGGGGNSPDNLYEFDDFVTNGPNATDFKFTYVVGSAPSILAPEANHPGIIRLASTGGNTMNPCTSVATSVLPADSFKFISVVRPNGHANADYNVGLWGNIALPPTNGIWMEALIADTNWHLVCRSGGTQTRVDTGVAIVNGTWYQMQIRRVNGTTIGAIVNGATEVTCTTNIPTAAMSPYLSVFTASGNQSIDQDLWVLEDAVTRF